MKFPRQLIIAAVLGVTLVGNSFAGRGDHYDDRRGYRSYHERSHHHHHHRHQQRSHGHWIGPAAALAIGGLMVGAAMAAPTIVPSMPRSVYSAPPPQQPNAWYYCQSSGLYYPHTQACPEGWVAVAPY